MGGCRCSFRNCQSATKTNRDLHFFHYPVKHKERCKEWIRNARRPDFFVLPDDQLRNKAVCGLHFEKYCFTNELRKRLVHNAVPTLAGGCEEEVLNDNTAEFASVDILPANDDGTIFTLETDSVQQKNDDPISTYSFKNGTLVPVYEEESTEPIVYTLDQDDFKVVPSFRENVTEKNFVFVNAKKDNETTENYEIVFNGESQTPTIEKKTVTTTASIDVPSNSFTRSEPKKVHVAPMEFIYVHPKDPIDVETTEPENPISEIKLETESVDKQTENSSPNKYKVKSKVLKQINNHSRQIASLRKVLLNGRINKPNKFNFGAIKNRVHPTLLGALTINVYNKKTNFTDNELQFLTTLYKSSPDCYNLLRNKLNWNLPATDVVENLIDTNTNF